MLFSNAKNLSIKAQRKGRGYTLIELMIVMLLMASMIAIVSPFAFTYLEKAEAKNEVLATKNWLNQMSQKAYYTGNRYTLRFDGKSIEVIDQDQNKLEDFNFQYVFWQPATVNINQLGFVEKSTPSIIGISRKTSLNIDVVALLNRPYEVGDELQ